MHGFVVARLRHLLRAALSGLSYAVFQLVLVLLYAFHLTRAAGSPFRVGQLAERHSVGPPTNRPALPASLRPA